MALQNPSITDRLWLTPEEARAEFPNYGKTMNRLEVILDEAQRDDKVTDQEVTAILATLHARALARLQPDMDQLGQSIEILAEATMSFMLGEKS